MFSRETASSVDRALPRLACADKATRRSGDGGSVRPSQAEAAERRSESDLSGNSFLRCFFDRRHAESGGRRRSRRGKSNSMRVLDGPFDPTSFLAYLEQFLVPTTLTPCDMVLKEQPRLPQGAGGPLRHPGGQGRALLLAVLLARPQSDRDDLRQEQDAPRQTHRAHGRTDLAADRKAARTLHPRRMRPQTPVRRCLQRFLNRRCYQPISLSTTTENASTS